MEAPLSPTHATSRHALLGLFGLALGLGMIMSSHADAAPHAGRLRLEIERLRVLGRALYLAAHPDDENTRVLAWLVAEKRVRAAYLSLTRGGGGQNLIGAERGVAVAMLRTRELAAARQVDGAEQLFTRARDFGYSKRADETLRVWDEQAVLGDVVWALRRYRPDIVLTRFAGDGSGRHGHHTASAKLALRAFALAKDPKAFPEQLRAGVSPWQPKRLLWNTYHWRPVPAAKLRGSLPVDVGAYSPLLGAHVAEIAARSRTMHKSQGFGSAPRRGRKIERFKLLAGAPAKGDLFDEVELGWRRVPGGAKVDRELARALRDLDAAAPEKAIAALSRAGAAMRALADHRDKTVKLDELGRAIADCAALHAEARADREHVAPGGSVTTELRLLSGRDAGLRLLSVRWPDGSRQRLQRRLPAGKPLSLKRRVSLAESTPISQPYWLASTPQTGSYTQPSDPARRGRPQSSPRLNAELTFATAQGFRFTLRRRLYHVSTDRVRGEVRSPALVAPPVLIAPQSRVLIFPRGRSQRLQVTLRAAQASQRGTLRPALPAGWRATPTSASFSLAKVGDEQRFTFEIAPPPRAGTRREELRLVATIGGQRYERGLLRVDYPHIEPISAFPKASVALVTVDLRLGGKRIGYLMGAGDELPASLKRVGYAVTELKPQEIDAARLRRFDAVIFGVRAYNRHRSLHHRRSALEAYMRGGGTLIVQYNTSSRWRPLKVPVGPYPLSIGRGRITDETAKLRLLAPRHRALSSPNRITVADFDGWVQERGLYFGSRWDKRYTPLLAGRDPKERRDQRGALLVAKVGKGHYVYTGLSFFRQLPAGVPGAYRLLANLLAL